MVFVVVGLVLLLVSCVVLPADFPAEELDLAELMGGSRRYIFLAILAYSLLVGEVVLAVILFLRS